jgi:ABC-type nitrate/sulfonate/bicarbonate transport system substrate-binding protein
VVRPGSTITTVAELKGKKVAVAKGSSANWILLKALQANHLSVSGIRVVSATRRRLTRVQRPAAGADPRTVLGREASS